MDEPKLTRSRQSAERRRLDDAHHRILKESRRGKAPDFSRRMLGVVAVVALLLLFSNPLGRAFAHGLSILPHELGHTVTSWLLGRPAAPIFSTMGFYTATVGDWWWFRLFVFAGWGYVLFQWCKLYGGVNVKRIVFALVLVLLFLFSAMRNVMVSWMGLGGEIIAAFMLCYWALSPYRSMAVWRRYAYFMMGCVLYVNIFLFVGKLCWDSSYIALYLQGSGMDAMTNDLHAVQETWGIAIKAQAILLGLIALLSLWMLWRCCRLPYDVLSGPWERIKKVPPFSKFLELKSKSKKLF